ncbi:MAG: MG2 domain-containing protein [Pirellulaceae bacterium]
MNLKFLFIAGISLVSFLCSTAVWRGSEEAKKDDRQTALKLQKDGNFNDALTIFSKLLRDKGAKQDELPENWLSAVDCLRRLNRVDEFDSLKNEMLSLHGESWRLHEQIAMSLLNIDHYGFVVAGEFIRGGRRGGGEWAQSEERDRAEAIQILVKSLPNVLANGSRSEQARFSFQISRALAFQRIDYGQQSWKLQSLTALDSLPGVRLGYNYGGMARGAPVEADGTPVFYSIPNSWEAARNDGERWRFAMAQAAELMPDEYADQTKLSFANFLESQFGVHTVASYGIRPMDEGDEAGKIFNVANLSDNETLARLATGPQRLKLPDVFNHISVFKELSQSESISTRLTAFRELASIMENRQQYSRAADYWRSAIELNPNDGSLKQRLSQIVDPRGMFENTSTQVAGRGATVDYRYRNGSSVELEAKEINIDALLSDVKNYLKSNPANFDWQRIQIGNLGYQILQDNYKKYVGKSVATWSVDLEPRENHLDRRVTITTPLQKAGAYLLRAKMKDGNETDIVLWVADTSIVEKRIDNGTLFILADAATGSPLPGMNVEFFGWNSKWNEQKKRNDIVTRNFAEVSDKDGFLQTDAIRLNNDFNWLTIARSENGRMAFLGFNRIWSQPYSKDSYGGERVYGITDRPIYRPGQSLKYKFWIRNVGYSDKLPQRGAGWKVVAKCTDPMGNEVFVQNLTVDGFGGVNGEHEFGDEATLGHYNLQLMEGSSYLGSAAFRIEEYKKPEFEVTVSGPDVPKRLGDKIPVKIEAKYYFGGPVQKGTVHYTVQRKARTERWYPVGRWDWLYGKGYRWLAVDSQWYPGFSRWGCFSPVPPWGHYDYSQPELVIDEEVSIGEDGTVSFEIDSLVAKELHGDQDHEYTITAEVVDASRRTIVGTGSVMVTRNAFSSYLWANRGYVQNGDSFDVSFRAQAASGKGVSTNGKLTLFRIEYDADGEPHETKVSDWDVQTDADGGGEQRIKATESGQFRLDLQLADNEGNQSNSGQLINVIGQGFDSANFQYNDLEILVERAEHAPGDKAKLLINTNRVGARVLLWLRPAGVYAGKPQVLVVDGKSSSYEIDIAQGDMPNFFVEATLIADGKIHEVVREIFVPPVSKAVDVKLEPDSSEVLPGAETNVKLTVMGPDGKPFQGSLVVTMYDRAIEYISGGSNVGNIQECFWNWKRHHSPSTIHNLNDYSVNLFPSPQDQMGFLGVFGYSVADRDDKSKAPASAMPRTSTATRQRRVGGGGFGGDKEEGMAFAADSLAEAAPMEKAASNLGAPGGELGSSGVAPVVRQNFADAAYWNVELTTDSDGVAMVTIPMPENLSAWKLRTWAMGRMTEVGEATTEIVTRKNVMIRLQAPRFFVERDEVVVSSIVNNDLEDSKSFEVSIDLGDGLLETSDALTKTVEIEAGGEARVDWLVRVVREGEAIITTSAVSDVESDAMRMTYPVFVHGMLKTESFSGVVRNGEPSTTFTMTVPEERRVDQSRLEIRYSPTLAGAMVDALPYLVEYPYGCTEQTLNRFVPTVVTLKILRDMKLDLKAIQEKRSNLNAQEIGDDVERAKRWKTWQRNPVFDENEVMSMAKKGVEDLTKMQNSDGGWGWFSGTGERSWPHTTAVVVHGLQVAKANDLGIVPGVLENGVNWLKNYQDQQIALLIEGDRQQDLPADQRGKASCRTQANDLDALVYSILVDAEIVDQRMADYLYRDRLSLSVYGKSLVGLAFHMGGDLKRRDMLVQNVEQFLKYDDENQTAFLDLPNSGYWWYWYGDEIESNTAVLKLLTHVKPDDKVTAGLVKYLLNNRSHGTYWKSTRDTAYCIEALAGYMKATGEDTPEMTVEVLVDGTVKQSVEITPDVLFQFDNSFVLKGTELSSGEHTIEIRRKGKGNLYTNAYLTNFTLEDNITAAGLEIKVNRKYYRLEKIEGAEDQVSGSRGQVVDQKIEKFKRVELANLDEVESGDLIEIELDIESKNDYEYVIFDDMKVSGCEPVELVSGYVPGSLGAYVEFRDERVAFFARQLNRGRHSFSYRMRAEIPGQFSALPTKAWAMYAPELRANSDELKIKIQDRNDVR